MDLVTAPECLNDTEVDDTVCAVKHRNLPPRWGAMFRSGNRRRRLCQPELHNEKSIFRSAFSFAEHWAAISMSSYKNGL
jgi:hypothetical protein